MSSIPDSVSSSMPDTIRDANLAAVYAQIMGASGALQDSLLLNPILNQSNTSISEDQFKHSLNLLNLEAPRILSESDLPLNLLSAKVDAFVEKEISKLPQPLQGALRANMAQHAKDEKTLQEFFAQAASRGEVVEKMIETNMPPGTDAVSQLREMIYLHALIEVASTAPPSEAPPPTIVEVGPIVNGALRSLEVTQKGALAMLATAPPGYGDYLNTIMSSLHGAMASLQQIQVSDANVDKQFAVALKTLADDHLKKAQKAIADKAAAEAARAAQEAEQEKQKWISLGILIGTILVAVASIALTIVSAGAAAPAAVGATSAAVSAGTTATVGFSAGSIAMITVDVAGIIIASVDYALNSVITNAMTEAFTTMASAMGMSQAEMAGLLIALSVLMFVVMKRVGSAGIKALEKVAVSEASAASKTAAKAAAKHLSSLGQKLVVRTVTANLALPLLMMSGAVGAIAGGIAEVMFPNDAEARAIATSILTIVLMLVVLGGIMGGAGSIARGGQKLAGKVANAVKGVKNVAPAGSPVAAGIGNLAVVGNAAVGAGNAGRVVGEGGEAIVEGIGKSGRAVVGGADDAGDAARVVAGGQNGAGKAGDAAKVAARVDDVAQPAARAEGEVQAVAGDVAAEAPAVANASSNVQVPGQAAVKNADAVAQPIAAEGKSVAGVAEEGISLVDDLKIGLKNIDEEINTAASALKGAKDQLASAEEVVRIAADDLEQLKNAVPPDAKMIMAAEKQLAQAKEAVKESEKIVKNAENYVQVLTKEKTSLEAQLKAAQDAAFNSSQLRLEKMVLTLQLTGKFAESGFNVWDYVLNMKMKTLAEAIAKLQKDSLEAKAAQAFVQTLMDKINADRDSFHDIAQDINALIETISQSGNNLLEALQSGGRAIFAG